MRALILATGMIAAAVAVGSGHAEEQQECAVLARTFAIPESSDLPEISVKDASVSLIGDPGSKSFGFSFRATILQKIKPTGQEKLQLYLYVGCDEKSPANTSGINVGIIPIGSLRGEDWTDKEWTLIAPSEASALVPLKTVQCVKLGLG